MFITGHHTGRECSPECDNNAAIRVPWRKIPLPRTGRLLPGEEPTCLSQNAFGAYRVHNPRK
jgi:hypothetical protein